MSTNKKIILILSPYVFTKFFWKKYEMDLLEKRYNVKIVVHQFINLLFPNFKKAFKKKSLKNVKNYYSINKWVLDFNKIKNKNILVYSYINNENFYSLLINYFVGKSSLKILRYSYPDVPEFKSKIKDSLFFNLKNISFFFFNLKKFLFNNISNILQIKYCDYLITSKKNYSINRFLFKNKNIKVFIGTAVDYSNFLISKKLKKKKSLLKFKYVVFLESPGPFNYGDEVFFGLKYPVSKENWSFFLNKLFTFIELNYKFKIVIAPHPKVSHDSNCKYYNNRLISKYSTEKLIKDCEFVVTRVSTAVSYAVIYNKPIISIYTNELMHDKKYMNSLINFSNILGIEPLNITKDLNENDLTKKIYVNKNKYKLYLQNYLNDNKLKFSNYKIIYKILLAI
jgi:hypothetical protein